MNRHSLRANRRIRIARKQSRLLVLESLEDRSLMAAVASGSTARAAAVADDAYENNDTRATAYNFGSVATPRTTSGLVMADSADWYKFTTLTAGKANDKVSINFQHSQGDMDLALYSTSGTRLRISNGASNAESVSLSGLAAGTYFVNAYGFKGATNQTYSLTVNVAVGSSTPQVADDTYENNDTFTTARDLGTLSALSTISDLVMADGHDWYKFAMGSVGTATDFVAVSSSAAQGNLDLELYTPDATRLAVANGTTNNERISLSGKPAGTYFVHVLGKNNAATPNYYLQIDPGVVVITPPPRPNPTPTPTPTPPPTPTPTPTPSPGAFNIQLRYSGLSATLQSVFQQAAAKWESVITGDLPNMTFNGVAVDDLLIDASGVAIDGPGNVLGQAGPDAFRTGSRLPYHGQMQFDTADLAVLQADGSLLSVIMHEMGHVLGIGTLWISKGLLAGANTNNPIFVGAQATAAYNSIFGTNVIGVPVENLGGPGTALAHWRESVLSNELMTGFLGPGSFNPLSRITIGSLADIGYTVNYAAADAFSRAAALMASASATLPSSNPTSTIRLTAPSQATPIVLSLASRYRGEAFLSAINEQSNSTETVTGNRSQQTREAATDALFAKWGLNSLLGNAAR